MSKFRWIDCIYLAINSYVYNDFHLDPQTHTPININYNTVSHVIPYSSPLSYNQYKIIFILQGIDMVMVSGAGFFYWNANINNVNSTHCDVTQGGM